jgi:hypothetical protein
MDVEPPTGDDLNRMLVSMKQDVLRRAAAEPPARRRPWARRHLGLTLGLVALLGIGGAGGALALVLPSAFQASPAATSSPSPAPTREPVPGATATVSPSPSAPTQPAAPTAALAIDCATLGQEIGVASIGLDTTPLGRATQFFTPEDAATRQAGATACIWSGDGAGYGAQLTVKIAPAAERGAEWISGLTESGLPSYGIGDASAYVCDPAVTYGCNATFVVGPWWVETTSVDLRTPTESSYDPERLRPVAESLATTLSQQEPLARWEPPVSTWASTSCEDLAGADVAGAIGNPAVVGPIDATYPEDRGIRRTQITSFLCQWQLSLEAPASSDDQLQTAYLGVAPGAGWAYGTETEEGETVPVRGADEASLACFTDDLQTGCKLDVLVDETWLEVRAASGAYTATPQQAPLLIAAAEAIIAAQAASAGQG